jgi:hypothetical protein
LIVLASLFRGHAARHARRTGHGRVRAQGRQPIVDQRAAGKFSSGLVIGGAGGLCGLLIAAG